MIFFQKVIAKIINSKFFYKNPFLDIAALQFWLNECKVDQCLKQVKIGPKSKFYEQAEVINLQKNNSKINIGENTHIRGTLLIFAHDGKIDIGNNCYVGYGTQIWSASEVIIGNDVLISHNCNIIDTNTHEENYLERKDSYIDLILNGHPKEEVKVKSLPIIIEDSVWVSFNVSILKGVKIGKGAIIGAGSVVLKNVDPFTLVAGNPAKFIKKI